MNKLLLASVVLEEIGYSVYSPLGSPTIIATSNNEHLTCTVRTAMKDGTRQRILSCKNLDNYTTHIIAVEASDGNVWLIPVSDIEGITNIRLGKRWELYKYTVKVYKQDNQLDTTNLSFDSLQAAARDAANKMKELVK